MARGNHTDRRYRRQMRLIDLDYIRQALDNGPDFWKPAEIQELFGIQWSMVKKALGAKDSLQSRGLGYHKNAVWYLAQQRQQVAIKHNQEWSEEIKKQRGDFDLMNHEWCDSRIIHVMLERWSDDETTIQELHDRAGVRPAGRVLRRYVSSAALDLDDEDNF